MDGHLQCGEGIDSRRLTRSPVGEIFLTRRTVLPVCLGAARNQQQRSLDSLRESDTVRDNCLESGRFQVRKPEVGRRESRINEQSRKRIPSSTQSPESMELQDDRETGHTSPRDAGWPARRSRLAPGRRSCRTSWRRRRAATPAGAAVGSPGGGGGGVTGGGDGGGDGDGGTVGVESGVESGVDNQASSIRSTRPTARLRAITL